MNYPTMITIPISLDARVTPNSREHHMVKYRIQQEMKETTYLAMQATGPHDVLRHAPLPLTLNYVIGLAKGRKTFDDDNAIGGMKWIRDAIAAYLDLNDRDILTGTLQQVRDPDGRGFVRVLISADPARQGEEA